MNRRKRQALQHIARPRKRRWGVYKAIKRGLKRLARESFLPPQIDEERLEILKDRMLKLMVESLTMTPLELGIDHSLEGDRPAFGLYRYGQYFPMPEIKAPAFILNVSPV